MTNLNGKNDFRIDELLQGLGVAVLKSIRDPFGIMARDYTILWLNRAMAAIHGGRHEDAVGQVCYRFFLGKEQPCEDCPLESVFRTGRTNITERHLDVPGGERRWGEVKAYPILGEDHTVTAAFVIAFDITDRKRAVDSQKQYSSYLSRQLDAKSGGKKTVYPAGGDIAILTSRTRREKDVLRLIVEGHTNAQVSELLAISPHTVKTHVINIFNKLGVGDRTQAAVMAIRYQLI